MELKDSLIPKKSNLMERRLTEECDVRTQHYDGRRIQSIIRKYVKVKRCQTESTDQRKQTTTEKKAERQDRMNPKKTRQEKNHTEDPLFIFVYRLETKFHYR